MFWQPVTYQAFIKTLRCVSMAALGNPVVPEVYWMLMTSPAFSLFAIVSSSLSAIFRPASIMDIPGKIAARRVGLDCDGIAELWERGARYFPSCACVISGQASPKMA